MTDLCGGTVPEHFFQDLECLILLVLVHNCSWIFLLLKTANDLYMYRIETVGVRVTLRFIGMV